MIKNKTVGAVILAAGQSRRMGQPKMLMPWGERTVIEQVVSVLREAELAEIVVVTGAEHNNITAALARNSTLSAPPAGLKIVQNSNFDKMEMLVSLQVGIQALSNDCHGLLVVLGDQPFISAAAVRAVVDGYQRSGPVLVVPSYQMRRGHPWLADRAYWQELMAMSHDQTLRDFLDAHNDEIQYVVVDAPEVLEDLDTPDDYQRLRGDR